MTRTWLGRICKYLRSESDPADALLAFEREKSPMPMKAVSAYSSRGVLETHNAAPAEYLG